MMSQLPDSTPIDPWAAPAKKSTSQKLLITCGVVGGLVVLCLCGLAGFGSYLNNQKKQNYASAHDAYVQAECATALLFYDKMLESTSSDSTDELVILARQERAECQSFQAALDKQNAGDLPGALLGLHDLVKNNPESVLSSTARQRSSELISQAGPQGLVGQRVCDELQGLLANEMISDRQGVLPGLYSGCGAFYESTQDFKSAAQMYDAFLNAFAADPQAEAIKAALASSLVKAARAQGAGDIPAPQVSGSSGGAMVVVVIQNDSPEKLRIVFSGPEARIEELEACATCQTYNNSGPETCPALGPVGRYELKPGTYDVVVESGSGGDTTPWTGTWVLDGGDEYSSCFFVVTTKTPN